MKRVVLVIGVLLVVGTLSAVGAPQGTSPYGGPQARAGACNGDCDRLEDQSCQDADMAVTVAVATPSGDLDRLQLKDGSCDGEPIQAQDRTQLSRPDK